MILKKILFGTVISAFFFYLSIIGFYNYSEKQTIRNYGIKVTVYVKDIERNISSAQDLAIIRYKNIEYACPITYELKDNYIGQEIEMYTNKDFSEFIFLHDPLPKDLIWIYILVLISIGTFLLAFTKTAEEIINNGWK